MPKKIPGDIVVWIDANMKENYQTFNKTCYFNNIKNLEIIQLKDNEHLQTWIQEYKSILGIPNVRLHYITNLNRTKERLG
jgi:ribosomal protein S18